MSDDNSGSLGPSNRYTFRGTYTVEVVHAVEAADDADAERKLLQLLFAEHGMGQLHLSEIFAEIM